jgi:Mrp family chromosome partitioning ATPase/capsular polysaccharide biosynthesis protein
MDIRSVVAAARRQWWVVLQAVVLIAAISLWFDSQKVPVYQASARLLVTSPDSSRFGSSAAYAQVQSVVIRSEPVAAEASKLLEGQPEPQSLLGSIFVQTAQVAEIVQIVATRDDPASAVDIANAFALGYIEYQRNSAVSGQQRTQENLQARLGDLQSRISVLNGALGPDTDDPALEAERSALLSQYGVVFSRLQELEFSQPSGEASAQIIAISRGAAPIGGSTPFRAGVMGAGLGFILGAGLALLREHLDDRIRTRGDAEAATGLTVLGELPEDRQSAKNPNHVAIVDRSQSPLAERVRSLRSTIDLLGPTEGTRRILVTSASAGDGKSLISQNLAAAYAQAGYQTLLVGADLRRSRLGILEVPADAKGLGDLISSEDTSHHSVNGNGNGNEGTHSVLPQDLDTYVRPTRQAGLAVLPPGRVTTNAAALLASRRTTEVLDELASHFDVVVVDTAPTLVADAAALAPWADATLIVAKTGRSRARQLDQAMATLESPSVHILGVVLNRLRRSGDQSAYATYYGDPDDRSQRRGGSRRRAAQKRETQAAKP